MRIVIVGYGEMLQALIRGVLKTEHEIVGVFRHEKTKMSFLSLIWNDLCSPSKDFTFIKSQKLKEINARSVNSNSFIKKVKKLKADIIIVGSWSEKFSNETIKSPAKACINVHPSLLPKYRGPNPYSQVIMNDESVTGITFHLMNKNFDAGDILHKTRVPIFETDTGGILKERCCFTAEQEVQVLLKNFSAFLKNKKPQNEEEASYFKQISLSDTIISFTKETSAKIDSKIKGLNPWAKCFISYKNEFFSFNHYEITGDTSTKLPGTIIEKSSNALFITCKDKKIMKFTDIQINRPFSKFLTGFYLKFIIKINSKAD